MCFCLLLMPKFYFSCRTICFLKANLIIMAGMKKYLIPLSIAAVLSGCQSIYVPTLTEIPVNPINTVKTEAPAKGFRLAPSHWADVAKISDEATRLGYQVGIGKMTKVQAAQYLNNFRKRLVGRNAVDDSMYEIYLRSAVDSQRMKSIRNSPSCISRMPCAAGSSVGKIWMPNPIIPHLPTF